MELIATKRVHIVVVICVQLVVLNNVVVVHVILVVKHFLEQVATIVNFCVVVFVHKVVDLCVLQMRNPKWDMIVTMCVQQVLQRVVLSVP